MLNSIISADFESILVPENNGKENPNESYMNKYEKYIACSYSYKLDVLMKTLVKLLKHTQVKMQFTMLLIVLSQKVYIALK